MDAQNLSKENDGIRFLLILIDTLSKYLRIIVLKQKSARDVLNAVKQVFESGVKCQTLRSDRAGEFKNRLLINFLKNEGIRIFFANQNSRKWILLHPTLLHESGVFLQREIKGGYPQ
jgi:IS30 family transposase